jgi:hypothetical protein
LKTIKTKKQLYYKQAEFLVPSTATLQLLLQKALKKLTVKNRHESIYEASATDAASTPEEWLRFINSPRSAAGFQFGVLVLYSPSIYHMVLSTAADTVKDELDVSKLPPPAGKQFMEAPLYFAIRDNHVVVLQSKTLRVDALEAHLNWLLNKAGGIDEKQRVSLSDTIPLEIAKKLQKNSVKKITLRAPFFEAPAQPERVGEKFSRSVKAATGIGLDLLRGILSPSQFSALKVEDMTDVDDIQLNLEIKVVGHKKTDRTGKDVMRSLMNAVRHVDDADFVHAEIDGIGTVKGNDMRIHDFRAIQSIDGVLVTADAFETMRLWVETLVDKGRISGEY